MKSSLKRSFVLVTSILCACTFGSTQTWVTSGTAAEPWAAAVNPLGSHLYLFDHGTGHLKVYVPGTNVVVASKSVGTTGNSTIVALAPDEVNDARVVGLHPSGYVRGYELVGGVITTMTNVAPRAMGAATARLYCDVDKADNGDLYITSVDTVGGVESTVLARRTAGGVWSTVALGDDDCHNVSYDDLRDVAVTNGGGAAFASYSATLASLGTIYGDYYAADTWDFDVLGGMIFAGGFAWVTDPHTEVWMFDLDDGAMHDQEHVDVGAITATQILTSGSTVQGMFAGVESFETVQIIELLE